MRLKRTIAGDIKSPASYQRSTNRAKKNNLRQFFDKLLNASLLFIICLALIYCILLTGSPKVSVNNQTYRSQSAYQAVVQRDSNFFHKTKITYSGDAVAVNLQRQFPEITSTNVRLSPFSTSPVIKLSISPLAFIVKSQTASYLVDGEGTAVIDTTQAKLKKSPVPTL